MSIPPPPMSGARGSKDRYSWNIILYGNGKIHSIWGWALTKILITSYWFKVARGLAFASTHLRRIHPSWAISLLMMSLFTFYRCLLFAIIFLSFSCYWRHPYPTFTLPYLILYLTSYLTLRYLTSYLTLSLTLRSKSHVVEEEPCLGVSGVSFDKQKCKKTNVRSFFSKRKIHSLISFYSLTHCVITHLIFFNSFNHSLPRSINHSIN